MYKQGSKSSSESSESAKYTVAEILSSMTSSTNASRADQQQAPFTPVSLISGVAPVYPTSSAASILTPTTLNNLEQTFGLANEQQQRNSESGFVPPVVNPIVIDPSAAAASASNMGVKREYDASWDDDHSSCSSTDPEWNPTTAKRPKTEKNLVPHIDPTTYLMPNSRRPTGPRKEKKKQNLAPEELMKVELRRERNKQAAAKCRQRRVDQTNTLINETENLEEENAELENEIQTLQQEAEQLQFILDSHRNACKMSAMPQMPQAVIKSEQNHMHMQTSSYTSATSAPVSYSNNHMTVAAVTHSSPAVPAVPASNTSSRPSTLPLRTTQAQNITTTVAGIPISTPSSGIVAFSSQLGLDTILDGHTGLTPLTAGPSITCSQQQHRNSSDSGSNGESSPNKSLISL